MLEITRVDHISMAVRELAPHVDVLRRLFGFQPVGDWVVEGEGYEGVKLQVPGRSGVAWEVLAPHGPDSYLARFLDGPNGPGLHHVAFDVPDVGEAVERLRALGIEPWGQPSPDGHWPEAYIHPRRGGNGFLYQLYSSGSGAPWHRADVVEPTSDAEGTLGITAINHLAHAHADRETLAAWYEQVLGMRTIHRSQDGDSEFLTQVLEMPGRQMRWEIIQPGRPGSFVQRFLDARGPAMHHVTFEVGDWARALAACEQHGVPIFGERAGVEHGGGRWNEAFIHPRHTGGFLAQFFWEERPGTWI